MADWDELYLANDVPDHQLSEAVAGVLGLSADAVSVSVWLTEAAVQAWRRPETCAQVNRNLSDVPDDPAFPVTLVIYVKRDEPLTLHHVRKIAVSLGVPLVTGIGGDEYGYGWTLVLPTGETRTVGIDDDDHFVLTQADRTALDTSRQSVAHSAA